jgi:hypothetical protein
MNKKIRNIKKQAQPKAMHLGGQAGQVVLMVLLASALVLTLGLSASKQATVETKIDTDQELLKKAFNAAESGIEYYLGTGNTDYSGGESEGVADLTVKTVGDAETLSFDNMVLDGSVDYFWLVDHNSDGSLGTNYYSNLSSTLNVCTVDGSDTKFKIGYFYVNSGVYGVRNEERDTSGGCVSDVSLAEGDSLLLSVMPIGDSVKIKLTGSSKFPIQGEEISSTGKVEGVNNTVTVLNKYVIPAFLLEAISSGGDVSN